MVNIQKIPPSIHCFVQTDNSCLCHTSLTFDDPSSKVFENTEGK